MCIIFVFDFTAPTGAPRNPTPQAISSSRARRSWLEPDLSHRNGEMTKEAVNSTGPCKLNPL